MPQPNVIKWFYKTTALACLASPAFSSSEHEFEGMTRARYSELEVDNNPGKAASLLLRGTLKSIWSEQVRTLAEFDYVATGLTDEHSDGLDVIDKPQVPDVPGFDLNQLWLRAKLLDFQFTLGRQRLELDDQRYVGGNGFWQNEQTFDAARVEKHLFSASNIMYTYLGNANRIFGEDADEDRDLNNDTYGGTERPAALLGDHPQDTHLIRLEVNEWDYTRWVVYTYIMDNEKLPLWSNITAGSRYEFTIQPSVFKYNLELEAARQQRQDIFDKPTLDYAKAFLGISYESLEISGRYEFLGAKNIADTSISFVTPLGSLHEFQGWADIFIANHGVVGVEDTSFKIKWRTHPWKFDLRYHYFKDSNTSLAYGTEIDVDISFDISRQQEIHLRFADFKVDEASNALFSDAQKVFLSYTLEF